MKLRRVWKGILWFPVVLLVLVILFEVAGMAVNHVASSQQTKQAIERLKTELSAEIVDRYTETGNTSGTGNHVDMLSVVVFRTGSSAEEIRQALRAYESLDEWSFWVKSLEEVETLRSKFPAVYPFLEEMDIPEDLEHSWLLYLNTSAPFPDNIEGH